MKKAFCLILILAVFTVNVFSQDNYDEIVGRIRQIEKNISRHEKKELSYKKKLTKYSERNDFISRARQQRYLNKLNKIHTLLFREKKSKRGLLEKLKPILIVTLRQLEESIIETTVKREPEKLLVLGEEYYETKKLFDFYFEEKIDIILSADEPEDVKEMKLKLIRERITSYQKDVSRNIAMIGKLNEQILFLEESNLISPQGEDALRDYIDFVKRTINYLTADVNGKRGMLEFYDKQLREFKEGERDETDNN